MLDAFIQRLRGFHPVSAELEQTIRSLDIVEAPRNTILLREGQREDFAWVII
jgi:hypothetical protein